MGVSACAKMAYNFFSQYEPIMIYKLWRAGQTEQKLKTGHGELAAERRQERLWMSPLTSYTQSGDRSEYEV